MFSYWVVTKAGFAGGGGGGSEYAKLLYIMLGELERGGNEYVMLLYILAPPPPHSPPMYTTKAKLMYTQNAE